MKKHVLLALLFVGCVCLPAFGMEDGAEDDGWSREEFEKRWYGILENTCEKGDLFYDVNAKKKLRIACEDLMTKDGKAKAGVVWIGENGWLRCTEDTLLLDFIKKVGLEIEVDVSDVECQGELKEGLEKLLVGVKWELVDEASDES